MKIIKKDIFDGKYQYLVHVANLGSGIFGAGVAAQIKNHYPEAYKADLATPRNDNSKLGGYSSAVVKNGKLTVINLYAQMGIGNDGNPLNRNLQYDFLFDSLYRLCYEITEKNEREKTIIGAPKLGAGLAGGEWLIIEAIIKSVESKFPKIEFRIYELPFLK